ncbi:hypothetical protein M406DRAFT_294922 [Cryphonectria parasitica EP155]|uniref:CST complex subunit Stn1 N-terminal domain-containing protein n=1 Tax=Cryphonectria parasitica (strain ATCC 38755 / EP155) TaxID=660469 RepID=A0A9P4XV75_CRYP1|nr:uncharacterized protein M406DRAFT_294922 [Cryphonectria parasitica EP155]KAF3761365.1 hypothetical protein M406DRAFT_294922 [Cryphonectria parasitica EP155]
MATKTSRPLPGRREDIEHRDGLPFYPQYCFRLSPTINTYCHLRAHDIDALTIHSGFRGQNVFFHLNHPVQWVRIAGMVVAIDEYVGRRIYTVDDSSGVCIECTVNTPKPDAIGKLDTESTRPEQPRNSKTTSTITTTTTTTTDTIPKVTVPADVDVGTIVDIKGGLALYRGYKQVKALKVTILRSTEQEVAFWEKIKQFRENVLETPWKLTEKEVRKCRKDEERRR